MTKNILWIVLSAIVLFGCNQLKEETVDIQNEKDAIKLVLEKYANANENQDMGLIEDIWCPSDRIVSFGTLSGEKLIGWESIRSAVQNQFNAFSNTFISYRDQIIEVNESGNTAWFSEIINLNFILNGEAHSYQGLRYTGVLVKKEGKWLLVQTHMSVPETPKPL